MVSSINPPSLPPSLVGSTSIAIRSIRSLVSRIRDDQMSSILTNERVSTRFNSPPRWRKDDGGKRLIKNGMDINAYYILIWDVWPG